MKILIFILLSFSAMAADKYVLPKEIVQQRDKVIRSKQKLDESIEYSFRNLCQLSQLTQAQHLEMMAYQQITKHGCRELFIQNM